MQHINYCSHAEQLTFNCHKGRRIMAQLFILSYSDAVSFNTRTCFSVSSDVKLALFVFPGIPTGDPAIVSFYDKRIYKKLRLKELSLSDPLYHGKKQPRVPSFLFFCLQTFLILNMTEILLAAP
jgi:hypothetical protein